MSSDAEKLAALGYKQELKREMTSFQNFGVSFSIISILTGISSLFSYGLNTGGFAVMIYGWIFIGIMSFFVGLAMAEITSTYPTTGGLYWWSAKLGGKKYGPFWSWVTGWFNLLGQVAVTAGILYACAQFIVTVISFYVEPNSEYFNWFVPTENWRPYPYTVGLIYLCLLVLSGLLNTFGVHLLAYLNNISVWWHIIGTLVIIISVLSGSSTKQSAKDVFTLFNDNTGATTEGGLSPVYVVIIGLLMSQYTFTGYDASAHMTEETKNATIAGPAGIQDYKKTAQNGVSQIFLDALGVHGATILMIIVAVAMFLAGLFSITSNSRMMYAFSRDGALPGSTYWHIIDKKKGVPIRTIWLSVILSFLITLPSIANSSAFAAVTSIATIGLYISYGIPILLRHTSGSAEFKQGDFNLGKFSKVVGVIAIFWICFVTVLFVLPQSYPVNSKNLNYSSIMVGIVFFGSVFSWIFSASKWFNGPVVN
ncbi:hypothetical protein HK099_007608, partial [Clydaea vesicula]